jgi:hypothetical protein
LLLRVVGGLGVLGLSVVLGVAGIWCGIWLLSVARLGILGLAVALRVGGIGSLLGRGIGLLGVVLGGDRFRGLILSEFGFWCGRLVGLYSEMMLRLDVAGMGRLLGRGSGMGNLDGLLGVLRLRARRVMVGGWLWLGRLGRLDGSDLRILRRGLLRGKGCGQGYSE